MADVACPGLRDYLTGRSYTRRDTGAAESWELGDGPVLRVVLWPRTTRVAVLTAPLEPVWTAEFNATVPWTLIAAFLAAAGQEVLDGRVTRLCPTCLHDRALEKTLNRAGDAEAELARLRGRLEQVAALLPVIRHALEFTMGHGEARQDCRRALEDLNEVSPF